MDEQRTNMSGQGVPPVLCYKKRVRTFFKYVFLPFCAGAAVLVMATPYFQHRLKFMAAVLFVIFGVALPVALRIQKTERAESRLRDEKVAYIERIYETDRLEREKASAEKQRWQAVREQLGVFLSRGTEILWNIQYHLPQYVADKQSWENEVQEYLANNCEQSFVSRFKNPSLTGSTQDSRKEVVALQEMQARMSLLHDFISDLQD